MNIYLNSLLLPFHIPISLLFSDRLPATVAAALTNVFGENFEFENHTYDFLNLPPRHYNSFNDMAIEMANSRGHAGIHYQATCDKSRWLGSKVAENVLSTLKFLED